MALIDKLTSIANSIRSKTGKDGLLTLDQMPTEIESISGGGDTINARLTNTLTQYVCSSDITTLPQYLFEYCTSLESFTGNNVSLVEGYVFKGCTGLKNVKLPNVKTLKGKVFLNCSSVETLDFNCLESVGDAFQGMTNLTSLIIRTDSVCSYTNGSTSYDPPNSNLKIYVPSELMDSYKIAPNWKRLAGKFYSIEGSEFE